VSLSNDEASIDGAEEQLWVKVPTQYNHLRRGPYYVIQGDLEEMLMIIIGWQHFRGV